VSKSIERNDPCHCGSGRKYKRCCQAKDEAAERKARAKAEAEAPEPEASSDQPPPKPAPVPKHRTEQPWKRRGLATRAFQKVGTPRKIGAS
jgi:hypothetical protein